jgi:E3 ubiquitin-protein ligase BRE1
LQHEQEQNVLLQSKLALTEQLWSQTLSNEKAAVKSVSDLVQKFNKRWTELTISTFSADRDSTSNLTVPKDNTVFTTSTDETAKEHVHVQMKKQIHELQHKLQQAMENVRQAEVSRENLKVALTMNNTLQSKLEEMKTKYAALQSARSNSTTIASKTSSSLKHATPTDINKKNDDLVVKEASTDVVENSNTMASDIDSILAPTIRKVKGESSKSHSADVTANTTNRSSTSTTSSSEKWHREYRKVRKELATMTANHAAMMTTNVRLLKQITEKDEMNAKSLSTILHLKSTTEKLIEERDHLEVQLKNASQLALAARLATNAKDRVSEEMMKEKDSLDLRRIELEEQLLSSQTELKRVSIECANASSSIATKENELSNIRNRCETLIEENERHREAIRSLKNLLSQTERKARETDEKLAEAMENATKDGTSGTAVSSSSFTVEQLQTQVSVLKNRLACPVCHYRDKECIIIRCRHMHCKQCVDERISNRSRKCPTCNIKFAENEVETIFLS